MKNKPNFFFDNRGFPNWGAEGAMGSEGGMGAEEDKGAAI